jgi:hypothetical protein
MEDAAVQISQLDLGLKMKKADEGKEEDKQPYERLKRYENAERDYLPSTIPGAVYKIELDNSHPLAFGYGDHMFVLKRDDSIYEYLTRGWNVGAIRKENYVSGFAERRADVRRPAHRFRVSGDHGYRSDFQEFLGKRQVAFCKCSIYGRLIFNDEEIFFDHRLIACFCRCTCSGSGSV